MATQAGRRGGHVARYISIYYTVNQFEKPNAQKTLAYFSLFIVTVDQHGVLKTAGNTGGDLVRELYE